VNKFLYIAAGLFVVGYYIYSKISAAATLEIKPLKFVVEPGVFNTMANVQLLLENKTTTGLQINMLSGKLVDVNGVVYGTFKNNYSVKIPAKQTIIANFTIETTLTDLLGLAKTNYKNLILEGTSIVDGFYIPFNLSFNSIWP
jgi:hypothetical protein